MGAKKDIQDKIAELQATLAVINRFPEDTFHIGTAVVFAYNNGTKKLYLKMDEESWIVAGSNSRVANSLDYWILKSHDEYSGYFEIYEMKTQPQPIYASA